MMVLYRALRDAIRRWRRSGTAHRDDHPDTEAARAAWQRHAIRVRDETLARVTFGQG